MGGSEIVRPVARAKTATRKSRPTIGRLRIRYVDYRPISTNCATPRTFRVCRTPPVLYISHPICRHRSTEFSRCTRFPTRHGSSGRTSPLVTSRPTRPSSSLVGCTAVSLTHLSLCPCRTRSQRQSGGCEWGAKCGTPVHEVLTRLAGCRYFGRDATMGSGQAALTGTATSSPHSSSS